MKSRFLYVAFSFLALFSSYAGIGVQKTVFLSSDVKTVGVYSPLKQVFICSSANDLKIKGIAEQSFSRSQKKTDFSGSVSSCFLPVLMPHSCEDFLSFSLLSESTSRVLILPKSVKNIIFLQTVI